MNHTLFRMVDVYPCWAFPTRLHLQFTLNNKKQDKHAIYQSVMPTIAYIKPSCITKYNYIHGWNTQCYTHEIDEKWIFLLIINRYRTVTKYFDTSSKWRNRVLHLGLHHFSPPSQWKVYKTMGSLGRESMCSPKGQRDAGSSINKWCNNEL